MTLSRLAVTVIAVIGVLAGTVFLLQGLRFLPSPVMYGEPTWVVIGGAMIVGGAVALAWTWRGGSA